MRVDNPSVFRLTFFSSHLPLFSFLQWATTDAFANPTSSGQGRPSQSVEDNYLDGVALLYGQTQPRTHIWSFASGYWQASGPHSCPCVGGAQPPSFVGNDYFCESGHRGQSAHWYTGNRLWDGQDCGSSACCLQSGLPFFTKTLPSPTEAPIIVKICGDQDDENIGLERMEVFVRWQRSKLMNCFLKSLDDCSTLLPCCIRRRFIGQLSKTKAQCCLIPHMHHRQTLQLRHH